MIVWNEPLCLDPGHVYNSVARATEEDIVALWKYRHPETVYTDLDALYEFVIVHWAWQEDPITSPELDVFQRPRKEKT